MAAAESDSKTLFSLDSYHVSKELGFILPDPLVSGTPNECVSFSTFLQFLNFTLQIPQTVTMKYDFQKTSVLERNAEHEFK